MMDINLSKKETDHYRGETKYRCAQDHGSRLDACAKECVGRMTSVELTDRQTDG